MRFFRLVSYKPSGCHCFRTQYPDAAMRDLGREHVRTDGLRRRGVEANRRAPLRCSADASAVQRTMRWAANDIALVSDVG